ncbi:MAG: DinB family protein [Acidobacteriia bacterium]|nr:DinB family protein [Terriglobia bacterium]
MTANEREVILKNLADSRERLLRLAQGLSKTQLAYQPAPGRWSVAENVEHLAVVETGILGMVQKGLEAPADSSKRSAMDDPGLIADVAGRITRFPAPEFLAPTGRWRDDELWPQFDAARKRTQEFAAATSADLRAHFLPHPIMGELDCYQWLLLMAAHCDRHCTQIEEVKASAGFPRAAAAR